MSAPPIPARNHIPKKAESQYERNTSSYLTPTGTSHHLNESPSRGHEAVFLMHGPLLPPLPPRLPLRRSVSLTQRLAPRCELQPETFNNLVPVPVENLEEMGNRAVLRQARTISTAASAPMLNQIIPVSRWPLRGLTHENIGHHVLPSNLHSEHNVIALMHWPLPESSSRLVMDCIVTKSNNKNEYVDGPTLASSRIHQKPTSDHALVNFLTNARAASGSHAASVGPHLPAVPRSDTRGLLAKMRRLFSCAGRADDDETRDKCSGLTVCRRCGKCRCAECARSDDTVPCCGAAAADCNVQMTVDVCSCMCCIRPVFYHCLKDENGGEEDCSDEPCACCDRPQCALRWTIMAMLLPCLPCLCLYLPLQCVLGVCRSACGGRSCRCAGAALPGLKGLLESESSST